MAFIGGKWRPKAQQPFHIVVEATKPGWPRW